MSFINMLFNKKERKQLKVKGMPVAPEEVESGETVVNQTSQKTEVERSIEVPEAEEEYEVVEREIHPAKIICPDCGGITLEGLEFCDKCGGELL
jgi:hypothetical protein